MAKLFERKLDEVIRLLCPLCTTTWDTMHVAVRVPIMRGLCERDGAQAEREVRSIPWRSPIT